MKDSPTFALTLVPGGGFERDLANRPPTARIWSPRRGVRDVAVAGFGLRRGRVIWSVSTTIRETVCDQA
jgi:hypothetical protein